MSELPEKATVFFQETLEVEPGEAEEWWDSEELQTLRPVLTEQLAALDSMDDTVIKPVFKAIQKETGLKGPQFFKPLRVALTGRVHGPDLMLVMKVLGKERMMKRLKQQG